MLVLGLCSLNAPAGGLWQGTTYPPANPKSKIRNPKSHWLILDTGGSGGAFGKGDIRQHLHDVVFWNRSLGWTCGYGGVFRTVDGGYTWTRMLPGGGWHQVEMTGPEDIWLLEGHHPGGIGKVWLRRSIDGGKTWEEKLAGKLDGYADMFCLADECWVLAKSAVWHSSDGGENWRKVDFGVRSVSPSRISVPGLHLTEDGFSVFILAAVGGKRDKESVLVRSDDSGQSWRQTSVPTQNRERNANSITRQNLRNRKSPGVQSGFTAMSFATPQLGWLGGQGGQVWRTTDGGESWRACPLPVTQKASTMWFGQTGRGFVALANSDPDRWGDALFETRDGGQTWTKTLDGAKQINRFHGLGPGQLWFVGNVTGRGSNDLVGILQPSRSRTGSYVK